MRKWISQFVASLQFRLLLLVALACAPLALLTVYHASEDRRQQVVNWQQRLGEMVQRATREEERVVGQTRQLLLTIAESNAARSGNRRDSKKLVDDLFASYPRYVNLGLIRSNGDFLASAVPSAGLVNQSGREFFRRVIATRSFALGEHPVERAGGKTTISFGHPVLDKAGGVQSVAFAQLDLDWFNRFESELQAQLPAGATWTKVDGDGTILVRYPTPEKWVGKPLPEAGLAKPAFNQPRGVIETQNPEGQRSLHAYATMKSQFVPGNAVAILSVPTPTLFAGADLVLERNLAGLAVAAALALLLGWIGSRFLILRQVRALAKTSTQLAAGDLSARTNLSHGNDEIGQLTRAFDQMAQALEKREKERERADADRARLAAILECSDNSIVGTTADGIVVNWNPGAERLYGYTAEEMIGRSISTLFTGENYQQHVVLMERVRRGERLPTQKTTRLRKDGSAVAVSVDYCRVEVGQGESVETSQIARELSRIKQLEEQFRQAQRMDAVGRLAGGVAHNFNNALTVISGYTEVLLEALSPRDPTRASLEEIKKAGDRATALTRQLLILSRKQVLEPRVVELNTAVANCEDALKRLAGENIDLVMVLDPALGRVKVDPVQLEQVLQNLVVNARDSMPQGGKLTIQTANAVLDQNYCRAHAQVRPGRYILLAVTDTGQGMDEQTKAHIFEPFFADILATREPEQSTGLGLAMIDGFIKQSGGHVNVQSAPGQGSTFRIYLPEMEMPPSAGN